MRTSDENYLKVFLKECKYIDEKVVRHIRDNLSDFLLPINMMKNSYPVNLFSESSFE